MSFPLVSVCIGSYNRERYIRETLDSVFAQTYPNMEVVVVDDASTDRTVEIVRSYGDRVRLIVRSTNSGICPITRNQAASEARGTYVAFLDSDDTWYPDKLARQVDYMEAHPEVPLCHTMCVVIDEESNVVGVRHGPGVVPNTGMIFDRLLEHCWITISTVMARRTLFEEIGWFNPEPPYGYLGEDHEFFLRVARKYAIGLVPEVLAGFRKAGQGITARNWKASPEPVPLFRALLKRRDIWGGVVPRSRMISAHSEACLANSAHWRGVGEPGKALYFCRHGLIRNPGNLRLWEETGRTLFRSVMPKRSPREGA